MQRGAGQAGRLALALGASALLHAWLLGGVSVHRPLTSRMAHGELRATLESGVAESDDDATRVPVTRSQLPLPTTRPVMHTSAMPRPEDSPPRAEHGAGTFRAEVPLVSLVPQEPLEGAVRVDTEESKPSLEMPSIVDANVYPPHELDVFPMPVAPVNPVYPAAAGVARLPGQATIELVIDEEGVVREAQLVDASPPGYFETAALESFRNARFRAAQRDGRAVRARIAIRVEFTPSGDRSGTAQ